MRELKRAGRDRRGRLAVGEMGAGGMLSRRRRGASGCECEWLRDATGWLTGAEAASAAAAAAVGQRSGAAEGWTADRNAGCGICEKGGARLPVQRQPAAAVGLAVAELAVDCFFCFCFVFCFFFLYGVAPALVRALPLRPCFIFVCSSCCVCSSRCLSYAFAFASSQVTTFSRSPRLLSSKYLQSSRSAKPMPRSTASWFE